MEKRVQIVKNGPYKVTGGVPLVGAFIVTDDEGISQSWGRGKQYEDKDTYFLCRCGGSDSKPYCDGTHAKNGFKGNEVATRGAGPVRKYSGEKVDLLDEEEFCASMRFCDGAPRE